MVLTASCRFIFRMQNENGQAKDLFDQTFSYQESYKYQSGSSGVGWLLETALQHLLARNMDIFAAHWDFSSHIRGNEM